FSGEIFSSLGLSFSAVNRKPDCARLPPAPPIMVASAKAPSRGTVDQMARVPISTPAPACRASTMAWGAARKGINSAAIRLVNQPPPTSSTADAPISDSQLARSGVLATSPFLRASSSFRGVASSVLDSWSFSSATGASGERHGQGAEALDEHRADHPDAEGEDRQAQDDAQRGRGEEDLELRHDPAHQPRGQIEDQ